MKKTALTLAALALTASVAAAPAASAAGHRPDTACMQAGIAFLKDNDLFSTVARDGLPVGTAVAVGVDFREGKEGTVVPDPIPLSVVLADHRAGADSIFVYPWC